MRQMRFSSILGSKSISGAKNRFFFEKFRFFLRFLAKKSIFFSIWGQKSIIIFWKSGIINPIQPIWNKIEGRNESPQKNERSGLNRHRVRLWKPSLVSWHWQFFIFILKRTHFRVPILWGMHFCISILWGMHDGIYLWRVSEMGIVPDNTCGANLKLWVKPKGPTKAP